MRVHICNLEARVHADVQMMHQLSRLTLYLKMEPFSQILCFKCTFLTRMLPESEVGTPLLFLEFMKFSIAHPMYCDRLMR